MKVQWVTAVSLDPAKANEENNWNLKYKYLINTANEYFCSTASQQSGSEMVESAPGHY